MIILLDGKEYAVGLNWFAISSKEEVGQFQREMDMHDGILKLSKDPSQPSTVALAPSEYLGQVSLAGILSYAYDNLLFVCQTGYKDDQQRDLYYLCTVKHHSVSVDGDVIADLDTIQSQYLQNLMELRTDIADESIEKLGVNVDDNRFEGIQVVDLHSVLTQALRFESQCVIKTLKKQELSKTSLVLIVILFLIGMYFAYNWFFSEPPPPIEPPPVAYTPPAQPQQPAQTPFQLFLSLQGSQLSSAITATSLPNVVNLIKTVPLQLSGWQVTNIQLQTGKDLSIALTLQAGPLATVDDLQGLVQSKQLQNFSLNPDGQSAVASWNLTAQASTLSQEVLLPLEKAGDSVVQYYGLLSALQREQLQASWQDQSTPGTPSKKLFTLSGNGLWTLNQLAQDWQTFTTLGITSLQVKPSDGTYQWEIQGIIYG